MHNADMQYVRSAFIHKSTSNIHNLRTYFDRFFNNTKSIFKDPLNESDTFFFYSNYPKLSDCEIIASSLTGESIGVDSEKVWIIHVHTYR